MGPEQNQWTGFKKNGRLSRKDDKLNSHFWPLFFASCVLGISANKNNHIKLWRKLLWYQNVISSEVKKKIFYYVWWEQSLKWRPGIYAACLTSDGWGEGCAFSSVKSRTGRGCTVLLELMAQERVSPGGVHKYSLWLKECTAPQEYLKKIKTLSSLPHMLQYCQLTSYPASQGKDSGISVTADFPVPKRLQNSKIWRCWGNLNSWEDIEVLFKKTQQKHRKRLSWIVRTGSSYWGKINEKDREKLEQRKKCSLSRRGT